MDVHADPENHRYVAEIDGQVAGFAVYHQRAGRYLFVHTDVSPDFEGRGVGSALASKALGDVRAAGRTVVPICPFIAGYIDRHPEYGDLVDRELLHHLDTA